jgi:predicted metal-dependent hydrolase
MATQLKLGDIAVDVVLKVIECDGASSIELTPDQMLLRLRPGADSKKAQMIVNEWYRDQIRQAASSLIPKWESVMGVKVERLFVRQMKTKWGTCQSAYTQYPSQYRTGQEEAGTT